MMHKLKKIGKKIIVPFVGPGVRVLHTRIFGKHLFINKYTMKFPPLRKVVTFIQQKINGSQAKMEREQDYKKWFHKNFPTQIEIDTQRKERSKFKHKPLISILLPTYNTKPQHLRDCINSVLGQSYSNWELCIADDASTDGEVRNIIKEYAAKNKKIKCIFRSHNGHISRASNSALELATGKFVALLDHDDYLWPNALYEAVSLINCKPSAKFIYSDEDKIDETGKIHSEPFFKPDWSFEFLRSINYITHFSVIEKKTVDSVGGFRVGFEGAQDWDLFLRISRKTNQIFHIPKVLYSWRKTEASTANQPSAKDYAYINQKKALKDDIQARGLVARLSWQIPFSMWRVKYLISTQPSVSIIIPTKNQFEVLQTCLRRIKEKTTYSHYEVVIVDTGSDDPRVWQLYKDFKKPLNLKVVRWNKTFNFSTACNVGAQQATGDYYLFLNNDTEVITPSWLEDMLGYASQKDIGAVGCKLYYPDGRLQHGGIVLGVGGQKGTPGIAAHFFPAFTENPPQDPAQLLYDGGVRNFAAVTAACLMVGRKKFKKIGGFDPIFRIAFNDVDFCLKLLQANLRNVYLPHVLLYHHESISVGQPGSKERDIQEFAKEIRIMLDKWGTIIQNDPYYHPAFRRDIASARLRV